MPTLVGLFYAKVIIFFAIIWLQVTHNWVGKVIHSELWKKLQSPDISIMLTVFAIGLGDLGSIPGRVIPKTQKMVLDATLLNTQHYKVRIKGKMEQSKERNSAFLDTLVL